MQDDPPRLGDRHRASGVNTFFTCTRSTFSEYIQHSRNMVAQGRAGLHRDESQEIISGNAPFELFPIDDARSGKDKRYRRGILLVHGLSDSPYFMRHLASFFQGSGFRVMAILLPGHGTRPGDLLDVRWQEWSKSVAFGIGQLALEVDEVYLGGYSAGGALSVYQSLRDARVRGMFLFAPALKISSKAAFADAHKAYSWLIPSAKWLNIHADNDYYKYESFPKNAAAQMYALTRAVQQRLASAKVQVPVFAAMSQEDATVDTSATVTFMSQASHSANKLVYYFSDERRLPVNVPKQGIELMSSVFPAKNIIGSAHTAIVLSGEDSYYGEHGEYCNCLHYRTNDTEKYSVCMSGGGEVKFGEITAKNLKGNTMRRLMYNPNFTALQNAMRQFIASLPD